MSNLTSLGVPAEARRVPRVQTYRIASIVSLLFPFTGIPALVASVKAGRLRKEGKIEAARERGERAREWCWYSLGYGLLAYVIVFIVLLFTANDHALVKTYFDGDVLTDRTAWRSLLEGFKINITVFLWTEAIVLVWALIVASVRLLPGKACAPIRFVSAAYTDVFRALPSILVLYLIVYGMQKAGLPLFKELSVVQLSILALSLVYGAYVAEVYRAGIESIHWSQVAAARSLGLSYGQTMRHVVVPQAVRRVFPPLLNDFIGLQKDTALIGVVGLLDMLARARFLNNSKATFTGYTMAAIIFLILTIPQTRAADKIIKRDQERTRAH